MIQGFFFDLDGTLVSTYEADYLAYRAAVEEVTGQELSRDGYMALAGQEIADKLSQLMPELTPGQVTDIRRSKKRHYPTYLPITELNEALVQFLDQFSHLECVLVTTAKADNVAAVFAQHDLGKYFSRIVSGDDVAKPKPDPEGYLLALKQTGLKASEVIAFEDSQTGIDAAEAAGIATVRVKKFLS